MGMLTYTSLRRRIANLSYAHYKFVKRLCSNSQDKPAEKDSNDILPIDRIRNFSIIAHVDHGKSTLADRLLEFTGAIQPGENKQVLDQLQVERERGITVKAVTATLNYVHCQKQYTLNLIDTPGHVDFSNEVARSVQACQGAILLVDAAEGPQAQTVAVYNLAVKKGLKLLPVLNKIDLPRANPDRVKQQLKSLFKIDPENVLEVSAKKGWGIKELIESLIERFPPPQVSRNDFFKALIFDTWHDKYRGILCLAYIQSGMVKLGDQVRWLSSPKQQSIKYLFLLTPTEKPIEKAQAGQVVVISCGVRGGGMVGDVLLSNDVPLSDIKSVETVELKHMVYAGIFPQDQSQHQSVQSAIDKLAMNDSAASVSIDSSPALGQGWKIGFLGLLHMEVFTQRLLQEHKAKAIITAPSVPYKVKLNLPKLIKKYQSEIITITNPTLLPDPLHISEYYEPFVIGTILSPLEYLGPITSLCMEKRGMSLASTPMDDSHIMLQFRLPLCEIIMNFHDTLKSITSGYATFDYNHDGFHPSSLTKMDIRLNGETIEELSIIIHKSRIKYIGRQMVDKLKATIPRQMIQIAIQAYAEGRVIARENLQAYRKDVTAKLYGGDVTRRMKLLKQQSEGKKKMKNVAVMRIPRETLIDILKK